MSVDDNRKRIVSVSVRDPFSLFFPKVSPFHIRILQASAKVRCIFLLVPGMQISMTQSFAHQMVADAKNNDGERQERDQHVASVLAHRLSKNQQGRLRFAGRMSGLRLGAGLVQPLIRSNFLQATEPGHIPFRRAIS